MPRDRDDRHKGCDLSSAVFLSHFHFRPSRHSHLRDESCRALTLLDMPPSRTTLSTGDRSLTEELDSVPQAPVAICAKFVTTTRTGHRDGLWNMLRVTIHSRMLIYFQHSCSA